MSTMTKCNFCSLQAIREDARLADKIVTVQGSKVFVHGEREPLVPWPAEGRARANRDHYVAFDVSHTEAFDDAECNCGESWPCHRAVRTEPERADPRSNQVAWMALIGDSCEC